MIKDLKQVKLTRFVFCQQCEWSFYEQTNCLNSFFIHLSVKNWGYSLLLKISFNNTISSWNFSYEEQMENERWSRPNLYATCIKLLKLVKTPLNVTLRKTDVTNQLLLRVILTSEKGKKSFSSNSEVNLMFGCLVFM